MALFLIPQGLGVPNSAERIGEPCISQGPAAYHPAAEWLSEEG